MIHAAERKTTRALLRRLALDTLGRTPSAAEFAAFVAAPVDQVATRLARSLEAMQVFVEEELFYFLLLDNFRPRTESIAALPKRLAEGKATAHDALAEVLLSSGFSLRNPGNDTFVTVVLEQCLGITVQDARNKPALEAGKKLYDGKKGRFLGSEGESQADVVKIVLAQESFTRFVLERHKKRLFGTGLTADDKATVAQVHDDHAAFFTVLSQWLASPTYEQALTQKRPKSDHQFIRGLYQDLLARVPTYEELRNMRNALQAMAEPAPLRAVVAKVILDSGKARLPECEKDKEAAFVSECFLHYLGRLPGQEEGPAYVKALVEATATPTHVVRALVGSAEYQYY